jgi:putative phosphonate metabolism protein
MRYAIYFTPPSGDALLKVAANWLGRSAFSGEAVKVPAIRTLAAEDVAVLTEEPRRYGFHGTLKAPFRLDEASSAPFVIPRLKLQGIGPFFALVPEEPVAELNQLANDIVVSFDRFRAPLRDAEIAKRRPERLSEAQRQNLDRWGYPYVFDEFRFHMTLTGPVDEKQRSQVERTLDDFFAPVLEDQVEVANLALFVEPEKGAPFEIHSLHPLTGGNKVSKRSSRAVGRP